MSLWFQNDSVEGLKNLISLVKIGIIFKNEGSSNNPRDKTF